MAQVKVSYKCPKYHGGGSATHEEVFDIPDHLSDNSNRIREFLAQKFNVGPHDVTVFTSDVL
jgi:hypothetical protein